MKRCIVIIYIDNRRFPCVGWPQIDPHYIQTSWIVCTYSHSCTTLNVVCKFITPRKIQNNRQNNKINAH